MKTTNHPFAWEVHSVTRLQIACHKSENLKQINGGMTPQMWCSSWPARSRIHRAPFRNTTSYQCESLAGRGGRSKILAKK